MATGLFSLERFRRSVLHFAVGRSFQALATLALTLLTVRWLGSDDYGFYMMAWGLVELGVPLTSLGLLPAVQRFLPELAERGTEAGLRRFVLVTGLARAALILLAGLVLIVTWPWLLKWLGSTHQVTLSGWLVALLIGTNLFARFTAELLECLLEQRYAQTARALLPLLRLAGLIGLWWTGHISLLALIVLDTVAALASWWLGEYWLRRQLRSLKPAGTFELSRSDLWTFVWHMSGVQLMNAVGNMGLLRLIVARTLGIEAAGQFAFLQQLVTIGQRYMPSTLLANMIKPMLIARHTAGRSREVAVSFGVLWKVNLALVWPFIPMMVLAGDQIVHLLSGGRVPQGGWPLGWLLLGLVATAQNQIVVMALQVYRYTALARRISLLALIVPVLAWAGSRYGLAGVAAGMAAAYLVRGTWGMAATRRQSLTVELDWPGMVRFFGVLAASAVVAWLLRPWFGPWGAAALLTLLCLVGTRFVRPVSAEEMELIGRALGPRARWFKGWARPA